MNNKTFRDREILATAQDRGTVSTLGAYFRLSGPGWLQSAITLGGGSLGGALYLGMLGGTSMLWLQLAAIVIGVIMLSAIAFVTLSTGKRPYAAINEYVNPVLGVGWITATILANMIWVLPQFSLCFDALDKTLIPGGLGDTTQTTVITTGIIAVLALIIVLMSFNPGWMAKTFDIVLKLIVGLVVLCFVGVAYKLFSAGEIEWANIFAGFIPDFSQWTTTAPEIERLLENIPTEQQEFWKGQIVGKQQVSMIGVTATAVGLNMTFLLPYSMLARGWDKPFRGLARFDLITGMAIPYLIVTTCIVIASAHAFHAKADAAFLSNDSAQMQTSVLFNSTLGVLEKRYLSEDSSALDEVNAEILRINAALASAKEAGLKSGMAGTQPKIEKLESELKDAQATKNQKVAEFAAGLPEEEKRIAPTLVKPNSAQLAATLAPLFGEGESGTQTANLVFGLGALAMGFSTIVILSLINGYAFAEILGRYESTLFRTLGALACLACGFCWFLIWVGGSKTWLIIVASSFGAILLPIAYIAFFALMNNRQLLGDEKPTGLRMSVWNVLMAIGVMGAIAQAWGAISTKWSDPMQGPYLIGGVGVFLLLALVGFSARFHGNPNPEQNS
ncbi:MAG: divalent metal cation transporter [Mariniblastus sp.]|nr:divalent metal cation transporter [Mariniblastus sp.]